ncbi:Putative protein of unknown function [Podospora comata]|uniref:Uncharacterized protein n=1 Tax=Podospora comata TaxID=48703 RepID=A0ABY6RY40_PODCO|nr:Putative protein of unknown function [Podospora comata]
MANRKKSHKPTPPPSSSLLNSDIGGISLSFDLSLDLSNQLRTYLCLPSGHHASSTCITCKVTADQPSVPPCFPSQQPTQPFSPNSSKWKRKISLESTTPSTNPRSRSIGRSGA